MKTITKTLSTILIMIAVVIAIIGVIALAITGFIAFLIVRITDTNIPAPWDDEGWRAYWKT